MLSSPERQRGGGLRSRSARSVLIGLAGGLFSGLTGVGGGAVMVPLLTGMLNLPQHVAHGTSLAIILFVGSAGLAGYAATGHIDWRLAGVLAAGSMVGVYIGARMMQRIPALRLRQAFGLFLLVVAARMFMG